MCSRNVLSFVKCAALTSSRWFIWKHTEECIQEKNHSSECLLFKFYLLSCSQLFLFIYLIIFFSFDYSEFGLKLIPSWFIVNRKTRNSLEVQFHESTEFHAVFRCSVCMKCFRQKAILDQHMRIHTQVSKANVYCAIFLLRIKLKLWNCKESFNVSLRVFYV